MNRMIKYTCIAICLAGLNPPVGSNLAAVDDTQKTTLILRDHRYRAALFSSFHELKVEKSEDFASKFQVTGFYNETQDRKRLGEVFGANCKNFVVVGTQASVNAGTADVENNFLLHYEKDPAANVLKGTLKFNPQRTTYGTHVEVFMNLDKILKGLYFKENMAVMHIKHNLGVEVCDSQGGAEQSILSDETNESHTLLDILGGKSLKRIFNQGNPKDEVNDNGEQAALIYAKLGCESLSRTGFSNIESTLGWIFYNKDYYKFGVSISLQSPTGDRPTAEFLWEPRLGSKHWGVGGGLEASAELWSNKDQNLKVLYELQYRYQFQAGEKRTLGIKNVLTNARRSKHILSHYYLLAETKKYSLHPAANVLTKEVDVEPGSQIDTFIALNYNMKKWTVDLGYNFFWKEKESVSLDACKWKDNTYAIAAFDWATCDNLDPFDIFAAGGDQSNAQPANKPINFCNLDTSVAETPSILSHTIFGSIGYMATLWSQPLMLALGGAYEFGDDRAAADSFTLWAKLALSF